VCYTAKFLANFSTPTDFETESSFLDFATKSIDSVALGAKNLTADIIDSTRSWIRYYTGLHNPNIRNPHQRGIVATRNNPNYVDNETFYYKLDPYSNHITPIEEYLSDTTRDEGLLSNIFRKKMMVSVFPVTTTTNPGTILFSAPISPLMFRKVINRSTVVSAPIDKMTRMSKFWSGDLEITLQNFGSNFHMFKLLIVRQYYPNFSDKTLLPTMNSLVNLPADIVEFSSGGQYHTIKLPMGSIFDAIPISSDPYTNQCLHGRVIVYLLQPMVTNGAVTTSVDVAVHLSACDNFTLYGYAGDAFTREIPAPSFLNSNQNTYDIIKTLDQKKQNNSKSVKTDSEDDDHSSFVTQCDELKVPENITQPVCLSIIEKEPQKPPNVHNFRPIVHIRDYIRRLTPLPSLTLRSQDVTDLEGVQTIPISDLLGLNLLVDGAQTHPLFNIATMFYGFRGGLKVKLVVHGCSNAVVHYFPPTPLMVDIGATYNNMSRNRLRSAKPLTATNPFLRDDQQIRVSSFARATNTRYFGPFLESSDHSTARSTMDLCGISQAPDENSVLASTCQFEFEIPWMNACRFVTTWGVFKSRNFSKEYYQQNLGYVTIGYKSSYRLQPQSTEYSIPPVTLYPYVGVDDTARFVYQSISMPLALPTQGGGAFPGTVLDTNFTGPTDSGIYNDIPSVPNNTTSNFVIGAAAP